VITIKYSPFKFWFLKPIACLNTPIYLNVLAELPSLGSWKICWKRRHSLSGSRIVPCTHASRRFLWSIFSWIANMKQPRTSTFFPEPRALTSTCQCSQVCQNWRRILLHASSLWGNVLDLDALSLGNDNWRNEILRRTGISLLSVRGIQQPLGRSKSSREFFYSLLEKNWDRIRLLHISHDEQPVNMHGKSTKYGGPEY